MIVTKSAVTCALITFFASAQAGMIVYRYDPAGRLTAADHASGMSMSYSYDPAGNLIHYSSPAPGFVAGKIENGQITFSWPASPSGFVLEEASSLGPNAQWTPVETTPVQLGNQLNVSLPLSLAQRFYRLRKSD